MEMSTQTAAPDAPDLLERFVEYGKSTFIPALAAFYPGGSAHCGTVTAVPDDIMPSHVGAFYITAQPETPILRALTGGDVKPITAMYVSLETAITVAAVVQGRTAQLPDNVRRSVLRQFKTNLKFVLHEATHSVGHDDIEDFQREGAETAAAGLNPWKEAITELTTQQNLDKFIVALGLDKGDPWLLDVPAVDTGSYVGTVEAARVVVGGLAAMLPNGDPEAELLKLVARGSGRDGLRDLAGRALAATGVTDPARVDAIEEMVADTFTQLDGIYKRTLSQLDHVSPQQARQVMLGLRKQGTRVGGQLLDEIQGGPTLDTAVAGRSDRTRTLQDLNDLVDRFLPQTGRGRRLEPGDTLRGFGVFTELN